STRLDHHALVPPTSPTAQLGPQGSAGVAVRARAGCGECLSGGPAVRGPGRVGVDVRRPR
ncbi:hypothetical protein ABTM33_19030, partial [Acinetobacter baumannii]